MKLDGKTISQETLDQLPDDLQAQIIAEQISRQAIIDALQTAIIKKRDEAVKFRSASGIEQEWTEDEDHFEGVDDANRGNSKVLKPNHPSGVLTTKNAKRGTRSTVFLNITRQYVDSAAASVSEMGNPTDDRNFEIKAVPSREINKHKDNQTPVPNTTNDQGQPVNATVAQFVQQENANADKKALAAQNRIDTYLIECQWHAHQRLAVHDAAKIGSGCLKGPVPIIQKHKKSVKGEDGKLGLVIEEETVPASNRISVWNLFPSPDAGDNIHKGSYLCERDFANARTLKDMKQLEGYIPEQIDKVLEAGPKKKGGQDDGNKPNPSNGMDTEEYEIWYCYGILGREEIEAMGVIDSLTADEGEEPDEHDLKALKKIEELAGCPCIVTMANDIAIRATLNPLDSGEYPYDIITWERRDGSPWGRGISRIMRDAQRICNAGLRNLMDNAGYSGGVQIGFKKGSVKPMGQNADWKLQNVGFWEMTDDEAGGISDVLSFTQIPSVQKELMAIIQFGQKMAEDVTGMPLLIQGQTGSAPDTVGGMQLLNKNSTATRRMIARQIDDDLTEPHIRRYYDWLLMYGQEDEKGDYTIDARGSQALVERDIASQFAIQMVANALQPAFGINPYKAMSNTLRAEKIDPKTWQYTEDEFKKIQQQQAQAGSQDKSVQVAQIRVASAEKIAAADNAAELSQSQIQAAAEVKAVQERTVRDDQAMQTALQADNNLAMKKLELEERIAMLTYSTKQGISLQESKTQLAGLSMKLSTEKQLAASANALDASMHVSDKLHDNHAQLQDQSHEKDMQGTDIAQTNAADNANNADATDATKVQQQHEQDTQNNQQSHERQMEQMRQRHAKELASKQTTHDTAMESAGRAHEKAMQAKQHKNTINVANLKPAVQTPGKASNGRALSQTKKPKK